MIIPAGKISKIYVGKFKDLSTGQHSAITSDSANYPSWTIDSSIKPVYSVDIKYKDYEDVMNNSTAISKIKETGEKLMTGISVADSFLDAFNPKSKNKDMSTVAISTNIPSFSSKYANYPIWESSSATHIDSLDVNFRFGDNGDAFKRATELLKKFSISINSDTTNQLTTPIPNQNTVTATIFNELISDGVITSLLRLPLQHNYWLPRKITDGRNQQFYFGQQ